MPINPPAITTVDYRNNYSGQLAILRSKPTYETLDTPVPPLQLVGYYDVVNDLVQLYISDETGYRWIRVG